MRTNAAAMVRRDGYERHDWCFRVRVRRALGWHLVRSASVGRVTQCIVSFSGDEAASWSAALEGRTLRKRWKGLLMMVPRGPDCATE